MRILHLRVSQVFSQCKNHLLEKVLGMYQGCGEDLAVVFLLLYEAQVGMDLSSWSCSRSGEPCDVRQ